MTYLLHLVERRLVHAELLEVILRSLDDLLDDLLVDITLVLLSARLPSPMCECSHEHMPSVTNHHLVRHGDWLLLAQIYLGVRLGRLRKACDGCLSFTMVVVGSGVSVLVFGRTTAGRSLPA